MPSDFGPPSSKAGEAAYCFFMYILYWDEWIRSYLGLWKPSVAVDFREFESPSKQLTPETELSWKVKDVIIVLPQDEICGFQNESRILNAEDDACQYCWFWDEWEAHHRRASFHERRFDDEGKN